MISDHWLVRGMGGVNIITLIAGILGGASLYFQLDKEIALIKRDLAAIERRLDSLGSTLNEIRGHYRQSQRTGDYPGISERNYPQ